LVVRDPDTRPVHTNQPLSSIEAFALALVEASSRLGSSTASSASSVDDVSPLPSPLDDEPVAAAE
jgi:hypothetical protein